MQTPTTRSRLKGNLLLQFCLTYGAALLIIFVVFALVIYPRVQRIGEAQQLQAKESELNRVMLLHDMYVESMVNTARQVYLMPNYAPFEFAKKPPRAYNVISGLTTIKHLNVFFDELFLQYKDDNYVYSSKSSYTLDMFFHNALLLDDQPLGALRTFFLEGGCKVLSSHAVGGYINPAATSASRDFLFFRYEIPTTASPYASLMFMVNTERYRALLPQNPQKTDQSLIFTSQGDLLITNGDELLAENSTLRALVDSPASEPQCVLMLNGTEYLAVLMRSGITGYSYINLEPTALMANSRSSEFRFFVQFFVLTFVFGAALFFLISYMNYLPIKKLARAASAPSDQQLGDLQSIRLVIDTLRQSNAKLSDQLTESEARKKDLALLGLLQGTATAEEYGYLLPSDMAGIAAQVGVFLLPSKRASPKQIISMLEEALPSGSVSYGVSDFDPSRIVLVLMLPEGSDATGHFDALNQVLESSFGVRATIGLSMPQTDLTRLPNAYMQARSALDYRHVMGSGITISAEDLTIGDASYPQQQFDQLTSALRERNRARLESTLESIKRFISDHSVPLFQARNIYLDIMRFVMKDYHYKKQAACEDDPNPFMLSDFDSLDALSAYVDGVCLKLCEGNAEQSQPHTLIEQILNYTDQHFTDPSFTVQHLTKHFELSPQKLIRTFQQSTGNPPLNTTTHTAQSRDTTNINRSIVVAKSCSNRVN